MDTTNLNVPAREARADLRTVIDHVLSGKTLEEALLQRVTERSRKAQDELVRKYGVREIAVDLVREGRDDG